MGVYPLLGKHPCTEFHGFNVAASIQHIPGNRTHPIRVAGQNCELCLRVNAGHYMQYYFMIVPARPLALQQLLAF